MNSLDTLSNQVSGLPANAVQTFAHRFHSTISGFREGKTAAVPTKFFISDPALFSAGGRNPYSSLSLGVNNSKNPLRIKAEYIAVGNQLGFKWIDNFDHIFSQNQFRSNPNEVCNSPENKGEHNVKEGLPGARTNPETINGKECNQNKRGTGISKIAARPKGFIHLPSIAGERK